MPVDRARGLPDVLQIHPLETPPDATVRLPGSKSLTNRALLCAGLADGTSILSEALFADDTAAMVQGIRTLGAVVVSNEADRTMEVTGMDIRNSTKPLHIHARQSGTTSRFLLPAISLRAGQTVLDGSEQLRLRPFGHAIDALRELGAGIDDRRSPGHLPLTVYRQPRGGMAHLPGHTSSQFLSGLLMAGPLMRDGLEVELTTPLVSVPYVSMTKDVMEAFGVSVDGLAVAPGGYTPSKYVVEPDASAASYFFAAAAITGGRISVDGLGTSSRQGDVAFVNALEQMGAQVEVLPNRITVIGKGALHGIDIDMVDISDTAPTLAMAAVFADGPTRVRGVGMMRHKETDRIRATVAELQRAGIAVIEHEDGFTIQPGTPKPTTFETYDDHRMAMSLSLLGLQAAGIQISNPGCVAKTYPQFFADLDNLRH